MQRRRLKLNEHENTPLNEQAWTNRPRYYIYISNRKFYLRKKILLTIQNEGLTSRNKSVLDPTNRKLAMARTIVSIYSHRIESDCQWCHKLSMSGFQEVSSVTRCPSQKVKSHRDRSKGRRGESSEHHYYYITAGHGRGRRES